VREELLLKVGMLQVVSGWVLPVPNSAHDVAGLWRMRAAPDRRCHLGFRPVFAGYFSYTSKSWPNDEDAADRARAAGRWSRSALRPLG
jgi:hypothetical protein